MRVRVLYFGVLKDLQGASSDTVELAEPATVAGLLNLLRQSSSNRLQAWSTLAVAVNREYVQTDAILHDGDEVALLPPVSGG